MGTLYEDQYTFLSNLARFFSELDISDKIVEKIKTYFMFNNFIFRKLCLL